MLSTLTTLFNIVKSWFTSISGFTPRVVISLIILSFFYAIAEMPVDIPFFDALKKLDFVLIFLIGCYLFNTTLQGAFRDKYGFSFNEALRHVDFLLFYGLGLFSVVMVFMSSATAPDASPEGAISMGYLMSMVAMLVLNFTVGGMLLLWQMASVLRRRGLKQSPFGEYKYIPSLLVVGALSFSVAFMLLILIGQAEFMALIAGIPTIVITLFVVAALQDMLGIPPHKKKATSKVKSTVYKAAWEA
ncbi:hypothetical protein N9R79_09205 [Vibrio sp.]|nr:hypothetical protein [Vibrio sp.]